MDLSSLSSEQLRKDLATLQRPANEAYQRSDQLEQAIQELQVHRIELEMQSRALREARCEIEQAVQRYSDLYDHLPIGYLALTATGEIVEANLTAATWIGVDRPQLRGKSISCFLNPFDAGRFAAHLEVCLQNETERAFETTLRLENGSVVPVQLTSRRSPLERGERFVLCAITNVSQLKQSQQLVSELKRDQDALGDSISHDLRSPLVTIGTYVRIILDDHGAVLPDEVKTMLERVDRAGQRMEATLKQLLAYNMMLRDEVRFEAVRIEELVQGVLAEYRADIERSKAEVTLVRPMHAVRACTRLLAPALSNVISNALKFTKPGRPANVTVATEERGPFIVIKIVDEGIGIDAQHHERIFHVFDRLHCYSDYPGAGVGLAIVRRAVERMNGQVWVESQKGAGSCFHLLLPRG